MNDAQDTEPAILFAEAGARGRFESAPRFRVATYRQSRTMTDEDWTPEALIESVRANFDPDGSLENDSAVEITVNYAEKNAIIFDPESPTMSDDEREDLAKKYDPGEEIDADYRNGAYARFRFDVEDGEARLSEFKDASPEDAGWTSLEFLRAAVAAETVVMNVPGVKSIEQVSQTLGRLLTEGEEAEIRRA